MVRLLLLLSISMFLVLLIGGEDRGQLRHGLIAAAPEEEPATATQVAADAPAPAAPKDVNLASFVPLSPPVPQPAVQRSTPTPEPVVEAPVAVAVPEAEVQQVALLPEPEPMPILFVNSNAINVRQGPSTNYAVVGRLTRNEAVLAVEPVENGWVRIRIEGDGVEGFVAARLLTDRDPSGN